MNMGIMGGGPCGCIGLICMGGMGGRASPRLKKLLANSCGGAGKAEKNNKKYGSYNLKVPVAATSDQTSIYIQPIQL